MRRPRYGRGSAREGAHGRAAGHLADAAAAEGPTGFVHIAALGADETSRPHYARTKALAEKAIREVLPTAAILRPSVVFGPEDSFFNRFASMARFSPFLPLIGGGTTRFQPLYVGDLADVVLECLGKKDRAGQTYELGGPGIYSFKELMELILATIGRRRKL